jgi:hypothetical protein
MMRARSGAFERAPTFIAQTVMLPNSHCTLASYSHDSLGDGGPMLTSKILSHRPTGPRVARPEDRLRPVPMAELGPGLRREDKEGDRTDSSERVEALSSDGSFGTGRGWRESVDGCSALIKTVGRALDWTISLALPVAAPRQQ